MVTNFSSTHFMIFHSFEHLSSLDQSIFNLKKENRFGQMLLSVTVRLYRLATTCVEFSSFRRVSALIVGGGRPGGGSVHARRLLVPRSHRGAADRRHCAAADGAGRVCRLWRPSQRPCRPAEETPARLPNAALPGHPVPTGRSRTHRVLESTTSFPTLPARFPLSSLGLCPTLFS